jgi:hypothetical protein
LKKVHSAGVLQITLRRYEGMAAEEVEYFSLHQGNGVSGGVRSAAANPKTKARRSNSSASKLTPFLQGITLGTVLLIPFGVWCWVRVGDTGLGFGRTEVPVRPAAVKPKPAPPAYRRKAVRAVPASVATPQVQPVEVIQEPAVRQQQQPIAAEPEPPPAPPPVAPASGGSDSSMSMVAEPAPQNDSTGQKPRKGIWRSMAAPFKGGGGKTTFQ